ncbi:hypothetical protein [Pseudomonas sp. LB1P83]|jgi:hypothetical protein
MDIYKDEVAFWDDFVLRYMHKNFGIGAPFQYMVDAADCADKMILERRKRNVIE